MSDKRAYYRIDFLLESPLSIGAADSTTTDHDVVLDSRDLPIIPATSLAGVYRSYFSEQTARDYFGYIAKGEEHGGEQSVIRVYDATWVDGNNCVSTRDNVSLKNKVAQPGLKFDRQIVEPGAKFRTYIEVLDVEKCLTRDIEEMIGAIERGYLLFGSKTTRGFGRTHVVSCLRRCFDLSAIEDRMQWLDFQMFDDSSWPEPECDDLTLHINEMTAFSNKGEVLIELDLEQCGALSIREYSTEPNRPDFGQLYVRGVSDAGDDVPVIPGTTWAGAFRDRYELFAGPNAAETLFGYVKPGIDADSATATAKSRIKFSESLVKGGQWKEITRNSIDRFTGGTKDGALFTMRTYYYGKTQLMISIDCADLNQLTNYLEPLLAVIADLHNGFMAIGGLTAVGHGLFKIKDARLIIDGNNYAGFYADLVGDNCEGLIQPNVKTLSESISRLTLNSEVAGVAHE